jgi:predicted ATPase/DNA-binding SARP family transcriptional activator
MIQFGILGPVEVLVDGEPASLGGPRQRAVLVRLLFDLGRVVSSDRMIEDVWDGRPPASAAKVLQKYVFELRRSLPDLPLLTRGGGYMLDVGHDAVDAHRFERLLDSGQYHAALALWRGSVLTDLPDLAFITPERARLEELRMFAIESRIENDLEAGRHGPVIGELTELIEAHPLRERLTRLLMLALYRSGRQVEALRAFQRHRRDLADDVGVAPDASLRQLEQAILAHDPRLDLPASPHGVERGVRGHAPIMLTSFIGRTRELDGGSQAVAENRLVTFTGPGGIGKTRLAIELGARIRDRFPGGVWTIDLAGVDDADLRTTIASSLEIDVRHAGSDEMSRIVTAVANRPPCLIVLDNCEHLVESVRPITLALLDAGEHVRVIATSRRPLGVDGEFVRPVQPLPEADAVLLFVDRARLTRVEDDEVSSQHAVGICRRLDGLPLAIELAASQLRVMDAQDLVDRLDDQLTFRGSVTDASPRQRTLGEMVQWSYGLLAPSAQRTFARLGAFASSLTLAAAEWVCAVAPTDRRAVLDDITALIDHSLLVREHTPMRSSRYRLLETLHLFALDRLVEIGEEDGSRRAHAEFFLALARDSRAEMHGPHERTWRDRLEIEEANLHAALGWAGQHDPELGMRLAVALWPYWEARWREREGVGYIDRLLRDDIDVPTDVLAWVLTAAAAMGGNAGEARLTVPRALRAVDAQRASGDDLGLAEACAALGLALGNQGRLDEADRVLLEGLDVAARIDDLPVTARLLDRAGFIAGRRGDHARAAEINRRELSTMRTLGSRRGEATALRHLAISLQHLGDTEEAEALCHRALDIWKDLDDRAATAHVQTTLADIARVSGNLSSAVRIYDEALVELQAIGDNRCTASTYKNLATIAAQRGDRRRATELFRNGLTLRYELGDEAGLAETLEGLASVSSADGRDEDASTLVAAASSVRERTGSAPSSADSEASARVLASGRRRLGADEVENAMERGRAMSLSEIVDFALGSVDGPSR